MEIVGTLLQFVLLSDYRRNYYTAGLLFYLFIVGIVFNDDIFLWWSLLKRRICMYEGVCIWMITEMQRIGDLHRIAFNGLFIRFVC